MVLLARLNRGCSRPYINLIDHVNGIKQSMSFGRCSFGVGLLAWDVEFDKKCRKQSLNQAKLIKASRTQQIAPRREFGKRPSFTGKPEKFVGLPFGFPSSNNKRKKRGCWLPFQKKTRAPSNKRSEPHPTEESKGEEKTSRGTRCGARSLHPWAPAWPSRFGFFPDGKMRALGWCVCMFLVFSGYPFWEPKMGVFEGTAEKPCSFGWGGKGGLGRKPYLTCLAGGGLALLVWRGRGGMERNPTCFGRGGGRGSCSEKQITTNHTESQGEFLGLR